MAPLSYGVAGKTQCGKFESIPKTDGAYLCAARPQKSPCGARVPQSLVLLGFQGDAIGMADYEGGAVGFAAGAWLDAFVADALVEFDPQRVQGFGAGPSSLTTFASENDWMDGPRAMVFFSRSRHMPVLSAAMVSAIACLKSGRLLS